VEIKSIEENKINIYPIVIKLLKNNKGLKPSKDLTGCLRM
jgi:hypothetical protein